MKILFAKTFGIGNAVMAIPALKALLELGEVSVLVGTLPDDAGAVEVFNTLRSDQNGYKFSLYQNSVPLDKEFDLAVLSIPFDGRWKNGVHFSAKRVMDGRTRPDPSTTGLVSWKKHEVEYQMDNAYELGYEGEIPSTRFLPIKSHHGYSLKDIYIGLGYKKDAAGFWKVKHWGNENFANLIQMIAAKYPDVTMHTTGNREDFLLSAVPILRMANVGNRFLVHDDPGLYKAFEVVSKCGMYVGNDTGMMHVAASCDSKVVGLFFLQNSLVKSRPWGCEWSVVDGFSFNEFRALVTPERVMEFVDEMRNSGHQTA